MSGKRSKTVKQAITEPKYVAPNGVFTIDGTDRIIMLVAYTCELIENLYVDGRQVHWQADQ